MNDNEKLPTKNTPWLNAWAYGCCVPVKPGYTGPSASAWELQSECGDVLDRKVKTSRRSDRRPWAAQIMAIVGVCESAPANRRVYLRVQDETLHNAIEADFISTQGAPMADRDCWEQFIKLREAKNLTIKSEFVRKGTDRVLDALHRKASEAAREKRRELGTRAAIDGAIAPRKKRR